MPGKRGDPVTRPGGPLWELRYLDRSVAKGWSDLCAQAKGAMAEAYDLIASNPRRHTSHQYRLKGDLGTRTVNDQPLEQWQLKPTGVGRIWYCVADAEHIAWITHASTGHPEETSTRRRRKRG